MNLTLAAWFRNTRCTIGWGCVGGGEGGRGWQNLVLTGLLRRGHWGDTSHFQNYWIGPGPCCPTPAPTPMLWSCQKVCEALTFLPDKIYIIFGTILYRQIVGIPMGTNCAHLVADLFLFCCERGFIMSLSGDKESTIIEAFNSTSRYLDDMTCS